MREISDNAKRILTILLQQSENGPRGKDPLIKVEDLEDQAGVAGDAFELAVAQLERAGYVEVRPEVGGRGEVSPKPDAFVDLDPEVKGWDPQKDACRIARTLLDSGQESINIEETMQEWGWEPRQMNPALFYLEQKDGGEFSRAFGRLRTVHVRKTRGTLLFAEEEC